MGERILVLDDEKELRELLCHLLREEGFVVESLESGYKIEEFLANYQPHLLLLDYRMPDQNGVEILKQLRKNKEFANLPVIMVTGIDTEEDKVSALELGADDYVLKPFSPKELSARIRAVLRRYGSGENKLNRLEVKGLIVDLKSYKVFYENLEICLTLTEFKILAELLKQKGRVLSRDLLRETALGNLNVTDRTIDVHMAALRKKLTGFSEAIETVRGVGYRLSN